MSFKQASQTSITDARKINKFLIDEKINEGKGMKLSQVSCHDSNENFQKSKSKVFAWVKN